MAEQPRPDAPRSDYVNWTPTDDAEGFVLSIATPDEMAVLRAYYLGDRPKSTPRTGAPAFDRVCDVAAANSARSVFVEWRYIDIDFRSEHSFFYSTTFQRYPSVCHRLHFFAGDLNPDLSNLAEIAESYLGYAVIRPLQTSRVGRSVLKPPPQFADAVLLTASDEVHLRGVRLAVEGMPFTSQDGQYLRCSHACVWMASYFSHLSRRTPRHLPRDVREAAMGGEVVGRQTPHEGLSVAQLLGSLHNLGFSAVRIPLPKDKATSESSQLESLPASICRYLNSNIPAIIYNQNHTWLCVGYYFEGSPSHDTVRFIVHDDVQGPYLDSGEHLTDRLNPWHVIADENTRWRAAVAPMPGKLYIAGARAERLGWERLDYVANKLRDAGQGNVFTERSLKYRTYAISSNDWKSGVRGRLPGPIADLYESMHLPRYIWVIEAIDRALSSGDCVVGEAIVDGTAHQLAESDSSALLARNIGGNVKATSLDWQTTRRVLVESMEPYETGSPTPIWPTRSTE
ncbi:MAG: hypothetical protein U0Q22_15550 [Acidimicrobiales bacterium]